MEKKVIVITGASGGLGQHIARHFDHANHHLILFHHTSETISIACSHEWVKLDFLNEKDVIAYLRTKFSLLERVDVLINNAGISRNALSWKLDVQDWNAVMQMNATVPFLFAQAAVVKMRASKYGRILNISSVVAQTGVVGTVAYASSKAALLGMTKTMAKETAQSGITVNALALGYFNHGMIKEVNEELKASILEQIPKKKLGDVATVLSTIDWLLGPHSDYVTGQTISLNGGLFCP